MSLMVVVSSCLYTALYTGFRAYRTAQAVADPSVVALNVIELLKRDIRGVLPPGGTLAGAFIGTDSGGVKGVDADSLEFHTTNLHMDDTLTLGQTTEPLLVGGIAKVMLLLEEDDETKDGTYLLLRQVTTDLLAPQEIEPEEQVLCRGVVSLNFCYFDGDSWLDEWDSTADANSLPQAIEIDLEVAHKDQRTREIQSRRLVQSFAIPCEAAAATEEGTTTGSASTGTNTNTQSGASAGGATAGGAAAGGAPR